MNVRLLPLFLCLVSGTLCFAEEPQIDKRDLFTAGDNAAFTRYHIPGLAVTARGTVLAWCEARKTPGDWADIRILLRRSTDDGRTWSDPVQIVEVPGPLAKNPASQNVKNVNPDDHTYNNPVLIAGRDGTVHMVFCLEYMRAFYQRSDDDGVTWSRPMEITDVFEGYRPDYDWKVLATGPNHGIQLRTGRLIVPVWLSTGTGRNAHRPSITTTIYSDDAGATWEKGDVAVPCTDEFVNPNETVAVELSDGRVMLNVRNESTNHRRLVTISPDGATGWSEPRFDEALIEPICMAGLVRYEHGGKSLLLFSNPKNLSRADGKEQPGGSRDRRNLTVRWSADDGETWSAGKTLEPGWSMYSDIAVTPAGTILCFYGNGPRRDYAGDRLTVARFNLAWLRDDVSIAARAESARIFMPHGRDRRDFIGPHAVELPSGDLLMSAPWGRPPADTAELIVNRHPVPNLYRSTDHGRTWNDEGPLPVRWRFTGYVSDGGVTLRRLADGRIALLMHRHVIGFKGGGLPVICFSSDDGRTWTDPTLIGDPADDAAWYVMNDRLVQTRSGRLLVPVARALGVEEGGRDESLVFYSDDGGRSWTRSHAAALPSGPRGMAEPAVAELNDGRLLMLARGGLGVLLQSTSTDGGKNWTSGTRTSLVSPLSSFTLRRLPDGRLVVFYNHAVPAEVGGAFPRCPLVYALSSDEGANWGPPVIVDEEGRGSDARGLSTMAHIYPGITFLPDGMLVLYSTHLTHNRFGAQTDGTPWSAELRARTGGKSVLLSYPATSL